MLENQCCMMSDKAKLRLHFKNTRNSINSRLKTEKELFIKKSVFDFIESNFIKIKTIFIYKSFGSEVGTDDLINDLLFMGYNILIPKCNELTETMSAVVYNPSKKQTKNSYGITEMEESILANSKIDLILAPGLAFDRFGNRIGFGKGYYDKFINSLNYKTQVVALAFSEQISDFKFQNEYYDCKMDYIITDKEIICTKE